MRFFCHFFAIKKIRTSFSKRCVFVAVYTLYIARFLWDTVGKVLVAKINYFRKKKHAGWVTLVHLQSDYRINGSVLQLEIFHDMKRYSLGNSQYAPAPRSRSMNDAFLYNNEHKYK